MEVLMLEFERGENPRQHYHNLIDMAADQFKRTGTVHPLIAAEVQYHVLEKAGVANLGYRAFDEALRAYYETLAKEKEEAGAQKRP